MSLVRLGYGDRLVVSPVWTSSSNPDFEARWFLDCKRRLKDAGAQLIPIDNGSNGHDRYGWVDQWRTSSQRAFELVQDTAEMGKSLVLSFDSPFMGLIPLLGDMPDIVHVHVPRGTGLQHTPACLHRLQYERESFSHVVSANTWVGAISIYMGEHLRKNYQVPLEKLLPIHCGILLDEHRPVPASKINQTLAEIGLDRKESFFLSFGRAEPYKGFHTIVEALGIMNTPSTLVLLAAMVDQREAYVDHLRSLIESTRSRVCLETSFDFWIPRILQQAPRLRAVIVPSLIEPFGLIAAEVLTNPYCSAQLVSSRIGGLVEQVVDGETGFLFAPGDPANLAAVLTRLVRTSNEELMAMRKRRIARRHQFDIQQNVASFLSELSQRAEEIR